MSDFLGHLLPSKGCLYRTTVGFCRCHGRSHQPPPLSFRSCVIRIHPPAATSFTCLQVYPLLLEEWEDMILLMIASDLPYPRGHCRILCISCWQHFVVMDPPVTVFESLLSARHRSTSARFSRRCLPDKSAISGRDTKESLHHADPYSEHLLQIFPTCVGCTAFRDQYYKCRISPDELMEVTTA
jgi:hypothetical protein